MDKKEQRRIEEKFIRKELSLYDFLLKEKKAHILTNKQGSELVYVIYGKIKLQDDNNFYVNNS